MTAIHLLPRRKAMRLGAHDYASPGQYFVTVVARERRCILGHIRENRVVRAALGDVVEAAWLALARRFALVRLGAHVVMPNHVHGLIEIVASGGDARSPTLSRIVATFKASATLVARQRSLHDWRPLWQRGFHDRVVRDGLEHEAIERYIEANPLNWSQDPENPREDRPIERRRASSGEESG